MGRSFGCSAIATVRPNWEIVWLALGVALGVALALVWPRARQLDWLARGDAWAATLGVPVTRRRIVVIVAAALATGAAVATAGAIGFVGLIVPHALRLLGVRSAVVLLPASALGGGAFVVLVDAVARTVVAPLQLPVGVLWAAIGVRAFIAMLLHRPRGGRSWKAETIRGWPASILRSSTLDGDAISRQGPRIADGAAAMCRALDQVRQERRTAPAR